MSKFISDCAQYEFINHAQNILWALFINYWKDELHYQHQNFADHHYQTVKLPTNNIIYRTGSPAYICIISLICMFFILNHTHDVVIDGIPITNAAGYTD